MTTGEGSVGYTHRPNETTNAKGMKMNREQIELLETLTTTQTAFRNWAEFKAAMDSGYVPTLRLAKLRKNASLNARTQNKAVAMLAKVVRAMGYKTFGNA